MAEKFRLSKPLPGHNGSITEVTIREPNLDDYIEVGDPFMIVRNPDGALFPVEDHEAVKKYFDRLVDVDPLLRSKIDLADAMKIKDIIFGFFTAARSTSEPPSN